jgi:hypothetical protein
MMAKIVSAFRISRTSLSRHPNYLFPFALWQAFPAADYYGNSVTLGLSSGRRSRGLSERYVRVWGRWPVRLLSGRIVHR